MPDAPDDLDPVADGLPPGAELQSYEFVVRTEKHPRLDVYLHAHFPWRSRTRFQELLANERVAVNGKKSKASYRVRPGDSIRIAMPAKPALPLAFGPGAIEALYEDPQLIVMNKPSGILTHPTAGHQHDTLMNYVEANFPYGAPLTCHRLDRETSGTILIVFDLFVRRQIQYQFEHKLVRKNYLAIVAGAFPDGVHEVKIPIRAAEELDTALGGEERKESFTVIKCLQRTETASLVRASPITGRQNQIRIHCAALGYPLIGDGRFGGPPCPPTTHHFLLHAARLCFHHPVLRLNAEIVAPLPECFLATLAHYGLAAPDA
jgi:23S rRNA pseudouridine1911/1915/1917 synthase